MKFKAETLEELVAILEYCLPDMCHGFSYIEINGKYREAYKLYGHLSLHDIEAYQLTRNIVEVIVDNIVYHISNKDINSKIDWLLELLSDTVKYVDDDNYT